MQLETKQLGEMLIEAGLITPAQFRDAVRHQHIAGGKGALVTGALQTAIFNSANFSSIATDEKGVIQIFNVGAERMLGYSADEVVDKITPADISDPQEVIARAKELSLELGTPIAPGFEALVFKAEELLLKPTTATLKKGALNRAVEQYNHKDSQEERNEHTVQIPSHHTGQ